MARLAPVVIDGRYELQRKLGRGGVAEVYLARDQKLDRAVAVKVLFPALASDPGFVERFRAGAQAAAALDHPNIVTVYDWGEANGRYYVVMEHVEGDSLADVIAREGRLTPQRAAEIAVDVASALGFAQRDGGVIHRDVKPANVLVTREGGVKVTDFDVPRPAGDAAEGGAGAGAGVVDRRQRRRPHRAGRGQARSRSASASLRPGIRRECRMRCRGRQSRGGTTGLSGGGGRSGPRRRSGGLRNWRPLRVPH